MNKKRYEAKAASEPRFADMVRYLRDLVWSGAFSGDEIVGAAQLAAKQAEAKRQLRYESYQGQPTVRPSE